MVIRPNLPMLGFRVDFLPPRSCAPLKRGLPKGASLLVGPHWTNFAISQRSESRSFSGPFRRRASNCVDAFHSPKTRFDGFGYGTTQIGYRTTLVGCRGGSRYFDEVCGFSEIPKIQKNDRPKIRRFHADPKSFGNPKDSQI